MPPRSAVQHLRGFAVFVLRAAVIYLVVSVGGIVGGLLLYRGAALPPVEDPAAFQTAMLVVNALHALMLAVLASRLNGSIRRSFVVLFCTFFGVQGLLTGMETLYFTLNGSLDLSVDITLRGLGSSAVTAVLGSAAAALVFKSPRPGTPDSRLAGRTPNWRFLAAIVLYPVVYWTAGLLIALPSEAVTRFYADSIDNINPATLLGLQIVRGAIWTGLAVLMVGALRGDRLSRRVLVGAAFSVFMVAQLLYPTDVLPSDVRWVHFIEITVSNFLYGFAVAFLVDDRRLSPPARV